jgi:activating signal cointegrator 1
MKALSLYQPWASLVIMGRKRIETRGWRTNYRGKLWIHASRSKKHLFRPSDITTWPFNQYIQGPRDLPLGEIIGSVDLVDCVTSEHALTVLLQPREDEQAQEEYRFGDYSTGRFAFILEKAAALSVPVRCAGSLGIWTIPEEVELNILAQFGEILEG